MRIVRQHYHPTLPHMKWAVLPLLMVLLSACTVRFAPEYDPVIEAGLVRTHEEIQQFLLNLRGPDRSYASHKAFYDKTLVTLSTLKLRAETRPQPPGFSFPFSFFNKSDAAKEVARSEERTEDISAANISDIIEILEEFRNLHETQDTLSFDFIENGKIIIESAIKSSLLYERLLERE